MRERLDLVLVARGIAPTRSRARDAILRGAIQVDGTTVSKPATLVSDQATIEAFDPAGRYVSRAALKLIAGRYELMEIVGGGHGLVRGKAEGPYREVAAFVAERFAGFFA